jgi:CHASE3 domain sensor protein
MTLQRRVIISSAVFTVCSSALAVLQWANIHREEAAIRRAAAANRVERLAREADYFVGRKIRAVKSYAFLGEEAEKLQYEQAHAQLSKVFAAWENVVRDEGVPPETLRRLRKVDGALSGAAAPVLELTDAGKRSQAMDRVEGDFGKSSDLSRAEIKEVADRLRQAADAEDAATSRRVMVNHTASLAVVTLLGVMGLGFMVNFYRTVLAPVRSIRDWAVGMTEGKTVALAVSGDTEIAQMVGTLVRMVEALLRRQETAAAARPTPVVAEGSLAPRRRHDDLEEAVEGFRDVLAALGATFAPRKK